MTVKERIEVSRKTKIIMQLASMDTVPMLFKDILSEVNAGTTLETEKISENGLRRVLTDMGKTYTLGRSHPRESLQAKFNKEVANLLITIAKIADEGLIVSPIIMAFASETLNMEEN